VSRQVIWEAQAIDQAAGFLDDDPDGVREMLDAVARLADEPRPAGSFPYGSPDRRRLRIGRYRVMYDIAAERSTVEAPISLALLLCVTSPSAPRLRPRKRVAGWTPSGPPPDLDHVARQLSGDMPFILARPRPWVRTSTPPIKAKLTK
jgi:mRNA interferase RelE/StbE